MSRKILIVEADNTTRVALAALLSGAGYGTIAVSARQTAMQALADEAPDLLIANTRLDAYSGLELVAARPRPIGAIMLAGARDRMLESEAHALGADVLVRPISSRALLATVARKLAAAPGGTAFSRPRRWTRKRIIGRLPARIAGSPVHVVDISYGGLQLSIDRSAGGWLPLSSSITLPTANLAVDINIVWKKRYDGAWWVCGAAVHEEDDPNWRQTVDAAFAMTQSAPA